MIIFYSPADGEPQRFDVGPGHLRASEIQIIERTAGEAWNALKDQISTGGLNAMRTVVWALKRRSQPALKFGEFDPYEGELVSRLDEREVRGFAGAFVEKFGDDPDQLAEAFDELRESAADSEMADKVIAEVTAPKGQALAPEPEPELNEASPSDG